MADPDRLVDWNLIEEIQIETLEPISCPICLYEPQCGKMTKCGHIYCWPCILHYLSLSDKTWRKCPICYESIYKTDLKSVRIIKHENQFKIGDEISMNLMFRFKNKYNTIILPIELYDQFMSDDLKSNHRNNNNSKLAINYDLFNSKPYIEHSQYFKLHSRSPEEIYHDVLVRERHALQLQFEQEKDQPESCFITEALVLLDEREASLRVEIDKNHSQNSSSTKSKLRAESKNDEENKAENHAQIVYIDPFTDEFVPIQKIEEKIVDLKLGDKPGEESVKSAHHAQTSAASAASANNDLAYFYQSNDGQRIFINSLNNRCLLNEYTNLSQAPHKITARIAHSDSHFLTEENRKRFKYLSHLPLHTEFKIIELDLKEPYLSKKTLNAFREEIDERRHLREKKLIREKREADRAAAIAEQAFNTPHYYVPSAMSENNNFIKSSDFENFLNLNEFPDVSSSPPFSSGASVGEMSNTSSLNSGGLLTDPNIQAAQVSFAQMIKQQNSGGSPLVVAASVASTSTSVWPTLSTTPVVVQSVSSQNVLAAKTQLTNGWLNMVKQQQAQEPVLGRTKKYQNAPSPWSNVASSSAGSANKNQARNKSENLADEEGDESMPPPQYKLSFFSAIDESFKMIESSNLVNNLVSNLGFSQKIKARSTIFLFRKAR